jgi:hypothetical protein
VANIIFFQAILEVIKEGSKAYSTWQVSREKKLLELCKDAAEKYIQINEGDGDYKDLGEKEKKKLLVHYRKRFFAYN